MTLSKAKQKRHKAIGKWLSKEGTNREWEAYLALRYVTPWKYTTYSIQEILEFVIIRDNHLKRTSHEE